MVLDINTLRRFCPKVGQYVKVTFFIKLFYAIRKQNPSLIILRYF